MYLKELCETDGVSGNEGAVRAFIEDKIRPYADEIYTDNMGNLIAFKKGRIPKTIMLSAHMDEVGFIVSRITDDGYLKFKTVGGIDPRVVVSKRVRIGSVPGIIALKAVHLQKPEEKETAVQISSLFIDIGASSKEEAEKKVSIGDYVSFATSYAEVGDKVKAKALDDRVGCGILIDLIMRENIYDTYYVFGVQEEVGLRGAAVYAHNLKPDAALVLEGTTCSDVYGAKEHEYVTVCGGGAAVSFADRTTIVKRSFHRWLYDTALKNNIRVQYKRTTMGGNDAGAIHRAKDGILTASLSVPCRYIHSPVSVAAVSDIKAVYELAALFTERWEEMLR
ncbi:MAG: M42 family metallopeptidase [Oscillospiraceae bacterium]|nr:M42 family metallopeptidase [Oscillospiraceae bacterium]